MSLNQRAAAVALLTTSLLVSACSGKAVTGGDGGGGTNDVQTDFGVTDDTITLGVQTDQTGAFKVIGLAMTHGHQIWMDEINENGGICGRDIALDIGDHGYKADNALPLFESQQPDILGMIQLLGSPILAALKQRITTEQVLSMPASWASQNLDSPSVLMIGATYDIEMINGMGFLHQQGMIQDGDKLAMIYLQNEAGDNTLMGAKAFAQKHNHELVETQISATDTDMTATITKLKGKGVKAILLMSSPATLASVAIQTKSQGLDLPIIGTNPTYAPNLLADSATVDALDNYYLVQSIAPYTMDNEIADKVRQAYGDGDFQDEPTQQIFSGYIHGLAWQAILEKACDNGDLTRQGIMDARDQIDNVDTQGLMGNLDFSVPGAPTTRETFIQQVDPSVPGGLVLTQELTVSDEAEAYKAPHEQ